MTSPVAVLYRSSLIPGYFEMTTAYNKEFVDQMRECRSDGVPWSWDYTRKVWSIPPSRLEEALEYASYHYSVIDLRGAGTSPKPPTPCSKPHYPPVCDKQHYPLTCGQQHYPARCAEPHAVEPYASLFLTSGAPSELVKAAYRTLSQLYHPDKPGGDLKTMQRVNSAYERLQR